MHGQYCTSGLGADGVRLERAKGQNLVAAIISCVSNESVVAAQEEEKQKLRNRGHGVLARCSY
jgi:hypothetical protein